MFIAKIKKRALLKEKHFLFLEKALFLVKQTDLIDKEIKDIDTFEKKVIDSLRKQREKAYRRRTHYKWDIVQNVILDVYQTQKERVEALTLATQSDYWNYTQRYRIVRY